MKDMAEKSIVYVCPMHPEVRQYKPDNCPKCGMTLKAEKNTDDAKGSPTEEVAANKPDEEKNNHEIEGHAHH